MGLQPASRACLLVLLHAHAQSPPVALPLPQASPGSGPALSPYEQLKYRAAAAVKLGGASGAAQPLVALAPGERTHFNNVLRNFQLSGAVKDQALALYVNSKVRLMGDRWLMG